MKTHKIVLKCLMVASIVLPTMANANAPTHITQKKTPTPTTLLPCIDCDTRKPIAMPKTGQCLLCVPPH